MVIFTIWFIFLLVVCANFFDSMLVGVMFGIVFVCLLVGGYILTLGMVSVLDFFITNLKVPHGFSVLNGQIIGHIGS